MAAEHQKGAEVMRVIPVEDQLWADEIAEITGRAPLSPIDPRRIAHQNAERKLNIATAEDVAR